MNADLSMFCSSELQYFQYIHYTVNTCVGERQIQIYTVAVVSLVFWPQYEHKSFIPYIQSLKTSVCLI